MVQSYEGLCQLINKTGICHQCRGLREFAPAEHRGQDLVQIEVAPGKALTPDNRFGARLEIVRQSDLTGGKTRLMHDVFFLDISAREERPAGS